MSVDPLDPPSGGTDHDLLIDMRRILLDLRSEVRTMKDQYGALFMDLGSRMTAIEKHNGDSPGRFVTTESPEAVEWGQATAEWQRFRGIGKYILGIVMAIISAIAAALTSVIMHGVVLGR